MTVRLPEGTKAKELSVAIKREALLVRLGPSVLLDVPRLNAHIAADSSTWTLEGGKEPRLVLTLEKSRPSVWRMLSADGQEGQ